jgi:hypothetical protein
MEKEAAERCQRSGSHDPEGGAGRLLEMLSVLGRELYFPNGILTH